MSRDYYKNSHQRRRTPSPRPRRRSSRSRSPPPRRDSGRWSPRRDDRRYGDRRDYDNRYTRYETGHDRVRREREHERSHRRGSLNGPVERIRDSSRTTNERRSSTKSPLFATATRDQQPQFTKEPLPVVSDTSSVGTNPIKMPRTQPVVSSPQPSPTVERLNTPAKQAVHIPQDASTILTSISEVSKGAEERIDSLLGYRNPTEKEKAFVDAIWARRIEALAGIQDMLLRKEELEGILQEIRKPYPASELPKELVSIAERYEKKGQEVDEIIGSLFEELLTHEVQMERHKVIDEALGQRLTSVEETTKGIKDRLEVLNQEVQTTPSIEPLKPQETGKDQVQGEPISDLQLESLTNSISELEAKLDDLDFGFDAPEFQNKVEEILDELRNQGKFDKLSDVEFTQEDEKLLEELESELLDAERWAEELDGRMAARSRGTNVWIDSFNRTLKAIETGEKALQGAKERIQNAETRLSAVKLSHSDTKNDDTTVPSLAEEVYIEAREQVELSWRTQLERSRQDSRKTIDRQIEEFRSFLEKEDGAEKAVWQQKERDIVLEMADALRETIQWQEAVVKWLG